MFNNVSGSRKFYQYPPTSARLSPCDALQRQHEKQDNDEEEAGR